MICEESPIGTTGAVLLGINVPGPETPTVLDWTGWTVVGLDSFDTGTIGFGVLDSAGSNVG